MYFKDVFIQSICNEFRKFDSFPYALFPEWFILKISVTTKQILVQHDIYSKLNTIFLKKILEEEGRWIVNFAIINFCKV